MFKCSCHGMKCDRGADAWNKFEVTRIFTTVEVFTFLHNILVRSTRDDMFGTTYMFGIGDGVGWGGVGMITYLYVAHVMTCSALRTCSALGMGWGGVGWGGVGMITYLYVAHVITYTCMQHTRDSGLLSRLSAGTVVYTDGCRSWNTVARQQRKKYLVVKSVVHSKSEWTRKVKVRGKNKLAGTQQIDRCWFHLKKFCPKQMKSRTGPTLNGRFWDRIYQWVFRHNSRKWQIHKLREKGQKNFSSPTHQNACFAVSQILLEFMNPLLKTHGCRKPCYQIWGYHTSMVFSNQCWATYSAKDKHGVR